MIKNGANIESPDEENTSILGVVSSLGFEKVAKILIENGASIDKTDDKHNTPLKYAIWGKHFDIVKLLIENGASINLIDNKNYTPINYAIFEKQFNIVKLLLEKGADFNYLNQKKYNYLQEYVRQCNRDAVKFLIKEGSDINVLHENGKLLDILVIDSYGDTTFDEFEKIIELLIENGYDINSKNLKGHTALHTACIYQDTDMINIFLRNGANVHSEDNDGENPIYHSITKTFNAENVKQLIDADSDLEKIIRKDDHNMSYLKFCITIYFQYRKYSSEIIEIIKLLCENCARLDSLGEDIDGDFLDYILILNMKYNVYYTEISPVVKILIDNGLTMDKKDKNGHTRLINAVIKGIFKNVRLLLKLKVNINIPDIRGVTAFTHAARGIKEKIEGKTPHRNIASLLAKRGANGDEGYEMYPYLKDIKDNTYIGFYKIGFNPNIPQLSTLLPELHKNLQNIDIVNKSIVSGVDIDGIYEGKTPLTRACEMDLMETVELLIENGASIEKKDREKNTPVMICSHNCKPQILKFLIKHGADVSSTGKNILVNTCFKDDLETAKILIDSGINIDGAGPNGYTSVHIAVLNDNIDLLKLLIENGAQLNISDNSENVTPFMLASNENKKKPSEIKKRIIDILTKNGSIIDTNSSKLIEFKPNNTFTSEDLLEKDEDNDVFFGRCEHIDHVKLKDGRCVYMTTRHARKLMMLKLNSNIDTSRIILPIQSSGTCWFFSTIVPLFVSDITRKNTKIIRQTMITGRKHYNKFNEDLMKVLIRLNIIIEVILNGNAIDSRFVFPIINNEEVVTGLKRNDIVPHTINCGGNSKEFALKLSSELSSEDPIKEVEFEDIGKIYRVKPIFIIKLNKNMNTSIEINDNKYVADAITVSYDGHVISGITIGGKRYMYDSNLGIVEIDWYDFFRNDDFEFSVNKRSYIVRLSRIYVFYNRVD